MPKKSQTSLTSWLLGVLLVMCFVVGVARYVAGQLLGCGERSRHATCDNIYVALNGEVANELDGALNGGTGLCRVTDATDVVECVLKKHIDEDNPLDRNHRAYVWGNPEPCQVALTPVGRNGVVFSQVQRPGASTRTFSIRID